VGHLRSVIAKPVAKKSGVPEALQACTGFLRLRAITSRCAQDEQIWGEWAVRDVDDALFRRARMALGLFLFGRTFGLRAFRLGGIGLEVFFFFFFGGGIGGVTVGG
jgi:hypothetical protein